MFPQPQTVSWRVQNGMVPPPPSSCGRVGQHSSSLGPSIHSLHFNQHPSSSSSSTPSQSMSARPATPPAGGHSRSSSSGSIHASGSSTPLPRRPAPTAPYNPAPDTSTYRDLLLFEERLKMNAEMLRRRRRRYSGESLRARDSTVLLGTWLPAGRIPGTEGASHGVAMSLVPAADADAAAKVWLIVLTRPVFLYSFIVALVVMAYRLVVMPPEVSRMLRCGRSPARTWSCCAACRRPLQLSSSRWPSSSLRECTRRRFATLTPTSTTRTRLSVP